MKIIIDTNVLISCFAFNRIPQQIVEKWLESSDIEAYYSNQIWSEVEQKFLEGRVESIVKKSKRIVDKTEIKLFLETIGNNVIKFKPYRTVDICRDPKDNMILELAAEIDADYIITGDKDLLVLAKFEKTEIANPQQFLEVLDRM